MNVEEGDRFGLVVDKLIVCTNNDITNGKKATKFISTRYFAVGETIRFADKSSYYMLTFGVSIDVGKFDKEITTIALYTDGMTTSATSAVLRTIDSTSMIRILLFGTLSAVLDQGW